MSGVFDGINFYIVPETARRLKDTNTTMVSLLTQGSGTEMTELSDSVSFTICTSADYQCIKQKARDSSFSCYVTPKWAFISQSVQHCVPFKYYSSDPFHIFSGFVFCFQNCSRFLFQVYAPLCLYRGAQILNHVVDQCTHIIVFNSADHPPSLPSYPQVRVVKESWLDICLQQKSLFDETPFLLQPISSDDNSIPLRSSVKYMAEWENEIMQSVVTVIDNLPNAARHIFKNHTLYFLPTMDDQEIFYLSRCVESMGGSVIPTRESVEATLHSSIPPNSSSQSTCPTLSIDPITAIICSYLTPEQHTKISYILQGFKIPIYSNCWVYNCIDQGAIPTTMDPFDTLLIRPPPAPFIPSLRNCIISITGFNHETSPTREQLKIAVESVGACYMTALSREYTTHLICLDTLSEKYKTVKMWNANITCVTFAWIMDCLREWKHKDESAYSLRNEDEVPTDDEEEDPEIPDPEDHQKEEEEALQNLFDLSDNEPYPSSRSSLNRLSQSYLSPQKEGEGRPSKRMSSLSSEEWDLTKRPRLQPKVFLLSSDKSANELIDIITSLDGQYIQTHDTFDASATHFIIASPKRTEKYLGAVACGMWILKPEYLEDCKREKKWLNEEMYEWTDINEKSKINGSSIRKWREKGGHAFANSKIVLVGDLIPSSEKWERIIVSSGGSVQITKGQLTSNIREFAQEENEGMRLCICPKEMRQTRLTNYLEEHGFLCVPTDFLLDYLSKDPIPDVCQYLLH